MNAQKRQWQRPSPDRERLSLWAAIRRLHIQGAEAPVHATLLTSLSLTSMVLGLACSPCFAEEFADALAPFPYQNRLYNPVPDPIPGLTGSPQPKGIAIFGGNVGAEGVPTTPNDGAYYLVQSGFGQPVAEPRRSDFLVGQEMRPVPELQADLTKAPAIDPPVKAFYLADVQKVFASEAGSVEITWKKADN